MSCKTFRLPPEPSIRYSKWTQYVSCTLFGTRSAVINPSLFAFLMSDRMPQLTKEQLLEVMNPLVAHLRSGSYVAYTYAAITIERILIIKQDSGLLFVPPPLYKRSCCRRPHTPPSFTPADIHSIAPELLNTVLTKVESAGSPEKVAENEHLMKCARSFCLGIIRSFRCHGWHELKAQIELSLLPANPLHQRLSRY
jgi:hypothetical protein